MVILKKYTLEKKINSDVYYVRSREELPCPYCGGQFQVIGSRKRILLKQDGSVWHLMIRRLRCRECGKISHELPDLVVPLKRYEAKAVESVLSAPDKDGEGDCCPAETTTMYRWRKWFLWLCSVLQYMAGLQVDESLEKMGSNCWQSRGEGWLAETTCELMNRNRCYTG